ncbi:MAG: RNA polymerase sigma factor [Terriglobia bacterium]
MSEELPAEELLARVAHHDVAALSELYDRYAPRVYGLMTHVLPERDAAEEILQELFIRLWSESPRLCPEGKSVVAWLVVTARDVAVDRLRAQRKNAPNTASQAPSPNGGKASDAATRKSKAVIFAPAPAKSLDGRTIRSRTTDGPRPSLSGPLASAWLPQPKEITLIDDRLTLLHKVIDQLPAPQRQALELAVFGGLSESEIAAEIGEPLGKVQRSLRAAVTFVKHRRRAVCGTWAANI